MPTNELDDLDPKDLDPEDPGGVDAVWNYMQKKGRVVTREEAEVLWRRLNARLLPKLLRKLENPAGDDE